MVRAGTELERTGESRTTQALSAGQGPRPPPHVHAHLRPSSCSESGAQGRTSLPTRPSAPRSRQATWRPQHWSHGGQPGSASTETKRTASSTCERHSSRQSGGPGAELPDPEPRVRERSKGCRQAGGQGMELPRRGAAPAPGRSRALSIMTEVPPAPQWGRGSWRGTGSGERGAGREQRDRPPFPPPRAAPGGTSRTRRCRALPSRGHAPSAASHVAPVVLLSRVQLGSGRRPGRADTRHRRQGRRGARSPGAFAGSSDTGSPARPPSHLPGAGGGARRGVESRRGAGGGPGGERSPRGPRSGVSEAGAARGRRQGAGPPVGAGRGSRGGGRAGRTLRGAARPTAPTYRRRRGDPGRTSAPPPPLQHGRPLGAGSALRFRFRDLARPADP